MPEVKCQRRTGSAVQIRYDAFNEPGRPMDRSHQIGPINSPITLDHAFRPP